MNLYEQYANVLQLCSIPESIQQMIFYLLVGYGTSSAHNIQGELANTNKKEEPIHAIILGPLDRCRHTLYYMENTINHVYDNSNYFSREALYHAHLIYLQNKKKQTEYTITKIQELTNDLKRLTKNRLTQLGEYDKMIEIL